MSTICGSASGASRDHDCGDRLDHRHLSAGPYWDVRWANLPELASTITRRGFVMPVSEHADGRLEPLDLLAGAVSRCSIARRRPSILIVPAGSHEPLLVNDALGLGFFGDPAPALVRMIEN